MSFVHISNYLFFSQFSPLLNLILNNISLSIDFVKFNRQFIHFLNIKLIEKILDDYLIKLFILINFRYL